MGTHISFNYRFSLNLSLSKQLNFCSKCREALLIATHTLTSFICTEVYLEYTYIQEKGLSFEGNDVQL